jgi:HEAT repeat protein
MGRRAVPILLELLNDDSYQRRWHQAAAAVGFIGDTSYFDTLRTFIWHRFAGQIDRYSYMAIRLAQCSLSAMATVSPRVLDYLEETSDPAVWQNLQWSLAGNSNEDTEEMMANESVIALGYTDSERAREILHRLLDNPGNSSRATLIRGALDVNGWVRQRGYLRVWEEQDPPPMPEGGK